MYAVGRLSNYISQGVYTVSAPFHPFGGAVDIIVVQQEDGTYKSTPWYVKFGKFQGVLKHREKIVTVSVNGSEADFHMYLDHKGEAYFLKEVESDEDDTILSPPSAPSSGDEGTDRQYSGRRISFKDDDFPRKIEGEEKAADDGGLEMPLANSPPPESIVGQNKEEILISFSEQSSGSCEKQVGSESPDGSSSKPSSTDAKNGTKNGKNISKSSSRKSIFSLVFRGRSQKNSESPVNASFTDQQGEGDDCHRVSSLERAERVADLLETKWVTGDTANRDEMTGKKSFEMSQLSGSSSSDALFVNGGSEQPEIETNSDSLVYSSLLSSSEQDIAIVGTISGESTCKNSVEILCSDVETSITEELGGSIVKLEYSVERTNSEEFYTQTEIDIAIANESADKYNDHREQITRSDPVLLSGISASAQDVGLTGADGGQNMIATPFSSLEGCLETSDSDTAPVDLVAPPFVLDVATEAFTRGCSNEEEQSEDSETQDTEDLAHIFPGIAVNESSSDCSAPILLDMNSRNSDLGDACVSGEVVDQDSFVESDKGMKTMLEAAIEPVTEGIVHSRECTEHTGKQDNEAAIHIIPGKGVNESSLCDCNTSTKITSADCNLLREVACTNKTIAHEHAEVTNSCNQLFQSRVNSALEENSQIECDLTILENVFDLEGEQNQIAQPVDEMQGVGFVCSNRYSREPDECGIEAKKTPANETSRIESREELELTFNDDYISDRGLALSEMSPSMETEEREHILPVPIERMNSECRLDGIGKINESNLEHLNDNTFQLSKRQTSPMNIPGMLKKGIGDTAQLSCSLPNMGLHFSDIQNSGTVRFYSRSLDSDSDHLKRHKGHDMLFPNSHNTEVNASEKETAQDWATAENTSESLKNLNKTETAIASVQSDTGIEISLCRHLLSEGMGIEAAAEAFDSQKVSVEEFTSLGASMVKNEKLVVKIGGRYFPWDAAAPIILGMVAFGLGGPVEPEGAIPVERAEKTLGKYASDSFVTPSGRWRLWPFGFRRLKTPERTNSARPALKDDLIVEPDAALQSTFDGTLVIKNGYCRQTGKHKVRSNTPTSEQLASLNLKEGQNIITFSFSTRVLGKQQVDARIYLWKWNTRIVVSDVDGTITKSDVLGQFMPLVGKDWTQSGVAHLFSAIKDNGYQLLFLSARAIAQAYLTRQFLLNVKQDGKALPDGPVVISPDGLFPSLYREVIRRAPHEFKIACLEDIRALFPPDCNPFYAGFGNRDTDEISYLKVGIPKGKIFIINPKGEVAVNHRVDMKSYTSLHKLVNGMFPAMSSSEQEDFNSWNYWKVPLPDIDV